MGAVLAFFRRHPLESSLFVLVMLMIMIRSCALNDAKEHAPRWAPLSLTETDGAGGGGGGVLEDGPQEKGFLAPPDDKKARLSSSGLPRERGAPISGPIESSRAADSAGSSRFASVSAFNLPSSEQSQSLPPSGAIYMGEPQKQDHGSGQVNTTGSDPLALIERGEFIEESPGAGGLREKGYEEGPSDDLLNDPLLKEIKEFEKKQTWISLEKAPSGVETPSPNFGQALKNSKVWVQIKKTRTAAGAALCSGCKVEKRILNSRATFYGEKY